MDVTSFRALGRHVAERQNLDLEGASADEEVRRRLAERAAAPRAHRARWPLPVLAAAALAAGALVLVLRPRPAQPLTFTVGQPARAGVLREWVSAAPEHALPLGFSDGTRMTLEPGGRGRVVRLGADGADVVLESGRARVEVVPREHGDWRIRTGPFVVQVHGTRFTVSWDAAKDAFSLSLHEGQVTVSGCSFGDGRVVTAGEEVRASCTARVASVAPASEVVSAAAPPVPAATSPAVAPLPVAPPPPPERAASSSPSWAELARAGYYVRAYEAATADGFEREVATSSPAEVLLLGDTARLSGHVDRAELAYKAARSRFPGTGTAATAAFALARVASDAGGDHRTASRWLETYLEEQPHGPFASAALGRLLEAEVKLGHAPSAEALARRYLDRYPSGPHADEARKVVGPNGATH